MNEQREVPLGEHVEQRAAPAVAGLVGNRRRWQLEPDEALVELLGEAGSVDLGQAGRSPAGERGAQRGDPAVVGVKQRARVLRRQVLDAEWARQADHRAADAVAGCLPCPLRGVVVRGVHSEGRFTGSQQRPAIQPRRA